jgi:hypothetical protein
VTELIIGLLVGVGAAQSANEMRSNIGRVACNATNGVYIGQIVDVTTYSAAGQASQAVYVVERDGRRRNAPPGNVTIAAKCPDGQPATPPPAIQASPRASSAKVDPQLKAVASEFERRLVAYGGSLLVMSLTPTLIRATWTASKCDSVSSEVIDFLLSLNRGHKPPVKQAIEAARVCGGKTRTFSASAASFELYRAGKINDPEILKGLK